VVITDAGDWAGDLTAVGDDGHGYGVYFYPVVDDETGDCEVWFEDESASVEDLPSLVATAIAKRVRKWSTGEQ
jgi:hypothetical protein